MVSKKSISFLCIALVAVFLTGCSLGLGSEDKDFDQKHAQEMQKKADKTSALVGETSPTLDLLLPEEEQDIVTEEVIYTDGVTGFLAYPQNNPQAPGVVVIHEWRGLNEHIKDMARVLAMNGYRALAVDLYNGKIASDPEQARALSSALDKDTATENLLAAEAFLRDESAKVASLGRCLGGAQSLNLSIASDTLDGTIIYYGRLTDEVSVLANINQPILGIFAENDGGIPPSAVQSFQAGLDAAGKTDYDITIYPGVDHAFANPTGGNHEKEATKDAWRKTLGFLQSVLGENTGQEETQEGEKTEKEEEPENVEVGTSKVVIDILGEDFAFSQETIEVTEGDTVTINFESTDGFHDWVLDEFDAATEQVSPGTPTSVTFVADAAGEYEYYCSVGQHRANGMVGTLTVVPKDEAQDSHTLSKRQALPTDVGERYLSDYAMLGEVDAPITFVEFSDYECPFCKRFTTNILPDIIKEYVDTGIVKFYFTDFALEIHPGAKLAAVAARCAGYQDAYYPMHDVLFEHSREINKDSILVWAEELALDMSSYVACLEDEQEMEKLEADLIKAQELGVTGTPSFLINGKLVKGAQPFAAFKQIIEIERENSVELEQVADASCFSDADCKEPATFPPYCSQTNPNEVCTTTGTPTCKLAGTAESACVMMITEECMPCDQGMTCSEGACVAE